VRRQVAEGRRTGRLESGRDPGRHRTFAVRTDDVHDGVGIGHRESVQQPARAGGIARRAAPSTNVEVIEGGLELVGVIALGLVAA